MTTKHTPGPWTVTGSKIQTEGKDSERRTIARMDGREDFYVQDANAHLIAAAPDLKSDLEKQNRAIWQLCDMVNAYSEKLGLGKKVNAADWVRMGALAKAEGRA